MARTIRMFNNIRRWATDRGIYAFGDTKTQTIKMMEELGEFSAAVIKQDRKEMKDALGDMLIVLVNLSHLSGFSLEECIEHAYNQIIDRDGKMIGGSFIKNESNDK